MIAWTNAPLEDLPYAEVRLLRAPSKGKLSAYILSLDLICTRTHFWKGRTTPCQRTECEPCKERYPFRWHGYLSIWDPTTSTPAVIELTALSASQVAKYRDSTGAIRGAILTAWRPQSRPNGRIAIRIERGTIPVENLPPPLDVPGFLALLWNAPTDPAKLPGKNHQPTEHKRHSPQTPPPDEPTILRDLLHQVLPE